MVALRTHVTACETGASPFSVRIEMGDHWLTGDEPVGLGGGGIGPSPFDLLTAALAECTAMTVRWFARQQGWPLDHVEVVVDHSKKVLVGAPAPIDVFDKTIFVHGADLSLEQREQLMAAAARCPVQRILERGASIRTREGTPMDQFFDT